MTAEITIIEVVQHFGSFTALKGINLHINAGEYIVLLGPSGCGKTTLLSILGGFLTPTSGRVLIGERDMTDVPPKDRPTTTMFQDYALFPHMTLRDNVGFGLRMRGQSRAQRDVRADQMLDMVGLLQKASARPHALSGGQRQRVALARALAVDPDVVLLDEPLGALDLKLRRAMQDELKHLQRRLGTTFVHVTHDQDEAMALADRVVVMHKGQIEDSGPPARIYLSPATLFTANFMGEVNLIPAKATPDGLQTILGLLPVAGPSGTLCLRPESIGFSGHIPLGPAHLTDWAFAGTHYRCHFAPLAAPDLPLIAHLPAGSPPASDKPHSLYATTCTVIP
jgi:spermidine/putrescine transport system ATP-binding protein